MKMMISILAGVLVLLAAVPAPAADKAGDIVSVRGKALIERQAKKVPAVTRAALQESDSVTTQSKSRIKMLFRDDSVLTLGQNSRLVIRQYLYSPEKKRAESIYELADGRLRAAVGSAGFKVTTPTAFAAARGTVFITWHDKAAATTGLAVLEGIVSVRNLDETIKGLREIKAGQMTFIHHRKPPTAPVPFNLKTEMEREGEQGEALADVSILNPPELPAPPPAPPAAPGAPAEGRRSIAHALVLPNQQPTINTTRVNLNLLFR